MAIQKTDIKLMASERLTDYYDGGGEMTGTEITDGEINNLFPDISRLDRTYGRVSLRKAFLAVMTANQDMYYGAHGIITQPPEDDNVHVTLFTTDDFYDIRQDAKDRVESYVSIAHELLWRPLNDQLEGQRAITVFGKPGNQRPEIGDTIVLKNSVTGEQQYVRITDLSAENATFANVQYGTFTVEVLTLGLSAALQYRFTGIEATPYTTKAETRVHATIVADASKYYGVRKLAQAASQGDMSFWVDGIYNQLVPTSQIETPLVDQLMAGEQRTMVPSGADGSLTWSGTRSSSSGVIHLPTGVLPGSLSLSVEGYSFTDDGGGNLVAVDSDGGYSGTIQYDSGQVTVERSTSWSRSVSITATPAAQVVQGPVTREIYIELANRAFNYTPSLTDPIPAPGSVSVSYMAQGKWYELRDNGHGELVGNEAGIGTGTIDYATGSMVLTVGALPDVGSSIILHWGHTMEITDRTGSVDTEPMLIRHELPHQGLNPGSISITWDDDGTPKTATDAGDGTFTGDATGTISYSQGVVWFMPTVIPESGTAYNVSYAQEDQYQANIASLSINGEDVTFTIPSAPLRPKSVSIEWNVTRTKYESQRFGNEEISVTKTARDDGNGNIIGDATGIINYTTGEVTFDGVNEYQHPYYFYATVSKANYANQFVTVMRHIMVTKTEDPPASVYVGYAQDVAASWLPQTDTIAAPALSLNVAPTTVEDLVATSLRFGMDGHTYYDYNGSIYRDKDSSTGAGMLAGEINYTTGDVTLTTYPSIADSSVTVHNLLTRDGGFAPPNYVFRTPGAPVRDGSLSVRGTTPDGTLISAIAANDGSLSDTLIEGTIDTQVGVVRLNFGEYVTAAGNEEETWYNADAVQEDGTIWKPYGVMPETALYNCVVYSFLPLDADIVGIEPIRLPIDGRVPIFKSGDVAVVHHTDDELLPDNLSAGQSVTLARDRLALLELRDQDGTIVDETLYTRDLDAGTVTMADPLDLSAYTQPLIAAHRIEDMVLISEAQINGLIRTVGPITHDYPAAETQVSSALIFGDLAARIVRQFTQKTWDGTWADQRSGDDTSAKYNDLTYPIQITNEGSIAQRWCIKFTSSTTFDVISANMGIIASGTTSSDVAPINPATDVPYFTIDYRGWGTGWSTGNCLRFDTSAANAPLWLARTTMQGEEQEPTDNFVLQKRGDAN